MRPVEVAVAVASEAVAVANTDVVTVTWPEFAPRLTPESFDLIIDYVSSVTMGSHSLAFCERKSAREEMNVRATVFVV